jgi:hypothetical protein
MDAMHRNSTSFRSNKKKYIYIYIYIYSDYSNGYLWIGRQGTQSWPPSSPDLTPLERFILEILGGACLFTILAALMYYETSRKTSISQVQKF